MKMIWMKACYQQNQLACWMLGFVTFGLFEEAIYKNDHDVEKIIAIGAYWSYRYALDYYKPFPLGEKTIATNGEISYRYARFVLNKPFPLGEKAIATKPDLSYWYAYWVLKKKPFPLGEKAIATNLICAYRYVDTILKKPWPLGEAIIATSPHYKREYETRFGVKI